MKPLVGTSETSAPDVDAVVVGAGFAGMYALYKLGELGMTARAFETGSDVGGTWYWNKYPGARCDAPSLYYCYSFSPELLAEWSWSEVYAGQPEIQRYAQHVADRFNLRRNISFETTVTSATWDETTNLWIVETDSGERVSARYLLMCTGCYSAPVQPAIPGIDTFEGPINFTARWEQDSDELVGKRIGIIGTGSSGVQTISGLAQLDIESLTIFQRSANFVIPSNNGPTDPEAEGRIKERYAEIWEGLRRSGQGVDYGAAPVAEIASMTDDEFEAYMEEAWPRGGPLIVLGITDSLSSEFANKRLADYVNKRMQAAVDDTTSRELVVAKNQHWGTRRLVVASGYFESLNQPNVELVDVSVDPVEIIPTGVRVGTREFPLDALVLATGFDTGTGPLTSIAIRGRNGATTREKWSTGVDTYLGANLHGFPNMFVIAGPGSPSIRSNMILSIEQHVDWVCDLLVWMREHNQVVCEATQESEARWTGYVAEVAGNTMLVKDDTPYVGANIPGKPRVYLCFVGGIGLFRLICEQVANEGYTGLRFTGATGTVTSNQLDWSGPPDESRALIGSRVI